MPLYQPHGSDCSRYNTANFYLLNVNDRNTKKTSEICSKLTIKTPEQQQ